MQQKLILEIGVDGGGAKIFRLANGTFIETGSAGGFLIDEEDDYNEWEKTYSSFEAFWEQFKLENGDFWVCFYPLYIDGEIKDFILNELKNYSSEKDYDMQKESWYHNMDRPPFF
jgi:hypothetical protein